MRHFIKHKLGFKFKTLWLLNENHVYINLAYLNTSITIRTSEIVPRRTKTTGMNTANRMKEGEESVRSVVVGVRMIEDEVSVGSVAVGVRFSANAIKLSKLIFG